MRVLDFVKRQREIARIFSPDRKIVLKESKVVVRFFPFESSYDFQLASQVSDHALVDGAISENRKFSYPVFFPKKNRIKNSAIVLLHGLNERSWEKYLSWAEYLAVHTHKPVILFPIAYHMNRSPELWKDPRSMSIQVRKRMEKVGRERSLCFANVALSERLSEDPVRFYTSGRQTVEDLQRLAERLKSGHHPRFKKQTKVDFFAYSIGAFLAEITLMSNPGNLFDDSRLFVFCGGSIFGSMYGESKCIMDKPAYDKLLNFYRKDWIEREQHVGENNSASAGDAVKRAFDTMIVPEFKKEQREGFFSQLGNRIRGISLQKDRVMPYEGVEACMGSHTACQKFELLDFPYDYSHESPFPVNSNIEPALLNASFQRVFSAAAEFLAG